MVSHLFRTLLQRLSEWRAHERAIAELSALDDRSLADLGISRSEIPYLMAREPEPAPPRPTPAAAAAPSLRRAA